MMFNNDNYYTMTSSPDAGSINLQAQASEALIPSELMRRPNHATTNRQVNGYTNDEYVEEDEHQDNHGQDAMVVDDSDNRNNAVAAESEMLAATEERRKTRPCYKLSVKLIDTYKNINKVYYENKERKLKEKRAAETNVSSSSANNANGRQGINNDGYDDANFNYILKEGDTELFDNRYQFKYKIGSGSFGQVFCAYDTIKAVDVAIKIIKSKKPFLVQAQTEIELLGIVTRKQDEESEDYNCITLLNTFMHRNHQCLVFEMLSFNLYDLLRNSKFKGVSFGLVRKFGRQILVALMFLSRRDVDIIHCDLKPENILLRNPKRSGIKIIDFGSSCKRLHRPYNYIQSRFYRSPEVLLCLGYDQKIDIWSLGCLLVEMHTGEPLFGGKDQLDQLFRIVTTFGMLPIEMIENSPQKTRSIFFERVPVTRPPQEFPADCDPTKSVLSSDQSAYYVMKKPKSFSSLPRTRPLEQVLGVYDGGPGGRRAGDSQHDRASYLQFASLIRDLLKYDPVQRLSAADAYAHPFFMTPPSAITSPISDSRYGHMTVSQGVSNPITPNITAPIGVEASVQGSADNIDNEFQSPNRLRSRSAPSSGNIPGNMMTRSARKLNG